MDGSTFSKANFVEWLTLFSRAMVAKRRRILDLNPEFLGAINRIAGYLAEDAPLYGFMLKGSVGNGKTVLLEALNETTNHLVRAGVSDTRFIFKLVTAQEIVDVYMHDKAAYNALLQSDYVIVDELGDEPLQVMEYGTPACPIHNFFYERYRRIKFTVIGTNLTTSAISKRYDERLVDRFKEMYPKSARIEFTHESYR